MMVERLTTRQRGVGPAMSVDPNWFYSSLAQCTAAIVGLLGALLVSRLQQQLSDFRHDLHDVLVNRDTIRNMVDIRIQRVRFHRSRLKTSVADMKRKVAHGIDDAQAMLPSYPPQPPGYDNDVRAYIDAYTIKECERRIKEYVKAERILRRFRDDIHGTHNIDISMGLDFPDDVRDDMHEIVTLYDSIDWSGGPQFRNPSLLLPTIVAFVIIWLSIFGLILPLIFLSASYPSFKLALILAFSLGITVIPMFIFYQIIAFKKLKRVVSGYQHYFGGGRKLL